MRSGAKMLLMANKRGGGNQGSSQGNASMEARNGGSQMGMGMAYGMAENAYGEMRGDYGRSAMREQMRGNYANSEMEGAYNRSGSRSGSGGGSGSNNSRNEMNYGSPNMRYAYDDSESRGGSRNEMNYARNAYGEMEDRMGGYGIENRRGGRSGKRYRRDSRGRFTTRNEMGGDDWEDELEDMESNYPSNVYPFPIYSPERYEEIRPMKQIGFAAQPSMHDKEYKQTIPNPRMNEDEKMEYFMMMGHAKGDGKVKLTKEVADEWMMGLQNEDGTKGPHWTFDQVKQVMAQKGIQADPIEFYVSLNAMYSDYCKVFRKYGVGEKLDFYIDMAKAFIEDKDAEKGKVASYYENIVKKQ